MEANRSRAIVRRSLALALVATAVALAGSAPAPAAKGAYPVDFRAFAFSDGTRAGTSLTRSGALTLSSSGLTRITYADPFGYPARDYDGGTWTGPWHEPGFGYMELVASWNADTPAGTWIEVRVRGRAADGHETKAYILGRWAYGDADIHRTSVGGQGDKDGYVAIDTLFPKDALVAYGLELTLYRAAGTKAAPTVTRLGAVSSDPVTTKPYVPSATTMTQTVDLQPPSYSQEIHKGDYPQYDNGGEAWCSPTSTSMVLGYWQTGPTASDYAYVLADYGPNHPDPWVDYAARYVYDYHYQGAGNWPFNTAYAAHFGLESEVTQLHSLAEAEQFIKAGIPLVASIAFNSGKLDGFFFKSTNGHLMVIGGFTATGDVIAYDPASPDDASVRHVYNRAQFEDAWMTATGGIVYVIHPASVLLPPSPGGNW